MSSSTLRRVATIAATIGIVIASCQSTSIPAPVVRPQSSVATSVATSVSPASPTTTGAIVRDSFLLPAGFDLQGHRGARGLKPENTLPAFETALDLLVTTLEFDLHLTGDDEIVVWHDPVVDASKCGLRFGAPSDVPDPEDPSEALAVRKLSVEQLSWYLCDRNPEPNRFTSQDSTPTQIAGSDYRIVTLDELIEFVEAYAADLSKTVEQRKAAAAVRFNMETKRNRTNPDTIGDGFDGENPGLFENRVLEIIEDRGIAGRATIQSFDIRSLRAIRAVNSVIPLAFLESNPSADPADLAAWDITEWSPNLNIASEQRIADAHAAGLAVKPWTVLSVDEAIALIDVGVDGLITDRPDLFSVDR